MSMSLESRRALHEHAADPSKPIVYIVYPAYIRSPNANFGHDEYFITFHRLIRLHKVPKKAKCIDATSMDYIGFQSREGLLEVHLHVSPEGDYPNITNILKGLS